MKTALKLYLHSLAVFRPASFFSSLPFYQVGGGRREERESVCVCVCLCGWNVLSVDYFAGVKHKCFLF